MLNWVFGNGELVLLLLETFIGKLPDSTSSLEIKEPLTWWLKATMFGQSAVIMVVEVLYSCWLADVVIDKWSWSWRLENLPPSLISKFLVNAAWSRVGFRSTGILSFYLPKVATTKRSKGLSTSLSKMNWLIPSWSLFSMVLHLFNVQDRKSVV